MSRVRRFLARGLRALAARVEAGQPSADLASQDSHPWEHPGLTPERLARLREASLAVHRVALELPPPSRPPNFGFAVNLAQTMTKWAAIVQAQGASVEVYPHPLDLSALNAPEWEDFDGEWADVHDGAGFLASSASRQGRVPVRRVPMDDVGLFAAWRGAWRGRRRELAVAACGSPGLRTEALFAYRGLYPYAAFARALGAHDALATASLPLAAYLSGRPYLACPVGGDLQIDCGRPDDVGLALLLSFAGARFLLVSNPHVVAHCRRLGLTNALFLPYPMDDSRYRPGEGRARRDWEAKLGPGVFVLSTARQDTAVKGQGESLVAELVRLARARPGLRFVFLSWGADADRLRGTLAAAGVADRCLLLPPVGKARLIDYYRSADLVLDTFVYGYYGATALEAAACGRPVVMRLRTAHYAPLYGGDVAPVENAEGPEAAAEAIRRLHDEPDLRHARGLGMRDWLARVHGEQTAGRVLFGLLRMAAEGIPAPAGLDRPLSDPLSPAEEEYHRRCLRPVP